jgi:hypothetical protein
VVALAEASVVEASEAVLVAVASVSKSFFPPPIDNYQLNSLIIN